MDETISLSVAAKMAGKSTTTIRRWISENLVDAEKELSGWKVNTNALRSYLSSKHVGNVFTRNEDPNVDSNKTELIRSLQVSLDRGRKINDELRSELLKITREMQAILKKESGNKLSRWIKDVVS